MHFLGRTKMEHGKSSTKFMLGTGKAAECSSTDHPVCSKHDCEPKKN
ncbi:Ovule protein [Caenorhabditis elegans]|uniref:Ovule protein n=1 Tax=Caenorhabditis elegans TaxID=6239 RepID=Q9XVY5_CAEEL|nr:Ovule protein [Caenorhabditis elegans]CAA22469.3 Ovule protein [Caenorhabditis elegans]|eukprot:NP_510602.3 Uncharacterized protein CELE_Y7A5A.9 [Caenorhabditis elegans]